MIAINNYELFIVSCLILNITPGTDTIYILSRSIGQGKRSGVLSVLGIMTGIFIHTILVAFGLSLIVSKSLLAFSVIKYTGAAYLICLGIKTFKRHGQTVLIQKNINVVKNSEIYFQGVLTNLLNPKVILFFLTFLPQFIVPDRGNFNLGIVMLGLTFVFTGGLWCILLVYFSSYITSKVRENSKISNFLNYASGFVFITLGFKVAFDK